MSEIKTFRVSKLDVITKMLKTVRMNRLSS